MRILLYRTRFGDTPLTKLSIHVRALLARSGADMCKIARQGFGTFEVGGEVEV